MSGEAPIDWGGDLVDQATAVRHVRLTLDAAQDADTLADLDEKITAASLTIRMYLDVAGNDPAWDAVTAPADVRAAVLVVLGALWRDRGDEASPSPLFEPNAMATVRALLARRRLPVTA